MSVVTQISPKEALELLQKDQHSVLVDVRTFEEFNFAGFPNADSFNNRLILLPWQIFPTMEENSEFDSGLEESIKEIFNGINPTEIKTIFLCKVGGRSTQAAAHVVNLGYKNSYNIINGFEGDLNELGQRGKINGWKAQNLPWRQK